MFLSLGKVAFDEGAVVQRVDGLRRSKPSTMSHRVEDRQRPRVTQSDRFINQMKTKKIFFGNLWEHFIGRHDEPRERNQFTLQLKGRA